MEPAKLRELIESSSVLKIPKGKAGLKITKKGAAEIVPGLNALLKQPLYGVKELRIDEVQKWEKEYEIARIELSVA